MKVILFDMDGTLTPARKKMSAEVLESLLALSAKYQLGIISGSDFDYITQQCSQALDAIDNIDVLPCNGTKFYKKNMLNERYELVHEANMREKINDAVYQRILHKLMTFQKDIMKRYPELPYTGTFFQYRGSLLNWCPIGRSASHRDRTAWKSWDKNFRIRHEYSEELKTFIADQNFCKEFEAELTVALGGSTSFDIYPKGWDKTYGLRHYKNCDVYFVGDKCEPGGNDYHIFKELNKLGNNSAWQTTSPTQTIQIIKDTFLS